MLYAKIYENYHLSFRSAAMDNEIFAHPIQYININKTFIPLASKPSKSTQPAYQTKHIINIGIYFHTI